MLPRKLHENRIAGLIPKFGSIRLIWLVWLQAVIVCHAATEAPTIEYLFPAGGKQGSAFTLSLGGKFEPWPPSVWTDCPGLKFTTNETKGKFTVEISTNAPIGCHLVRFYNEAGTSAPRCLVVGHLPEEMEVEPNDDPGKSQLLESLPVTINGRFDKVDDSDSFKMRLAEGQWLVVSMDAYSVDSPVDPLFHLLDCDGAKVAFNHDGKSLDPFLAYRAEKAGIFTLQLAAFAYPPKAEVRFTGGNPAVYRLTISAGPTARFAFPLGVQRGGKTALQVFGWNLDADGNAIAKEFDASEIEKRAKQAVIPLPGIDNHLSVAVGDHPEAIDREPNDTTDQAQAISIPCAISGRIERAGDEDRFRFHARKSDLFVFRLESASLGFPLDAWVKVEDQTGKELTRSDDSGRSPDPELSWNAPADGAYSIVVGDLIERGGSDFLYRLQLDQPKPAFKAATDNHALRLEAGKTGELKVNVARLHGFDSSILVLADELPEGITSMASSVPAKGGEVVLKLAATENAKAANKPIRVLAIQPDIETPQVHVVVANLKGQNAAAGDLLVNQTEAIWLTVIPTPPASESKAETKTEAKPKQ